MVQHTNHVAYNTKHIDKPARAPPAPPPSYTPLTAYEQLNDELEQLEQRVHQTYITWESERDNQKLEHVVQLQLTDKMTGHFRKYFKVNYKIWCIFSQLMLKK